jgi:hypothetical protein
MSLSQREPSRGYPAIPDSAIALSAGYSDGATRMFCARPLWRRSDPSESSLCQGGSSSGVGARQGEPAGGPSVVEG